MPREQRPEAIIPSFRVSNVIKKGLDISESDYFVILSGDDYFEDSKMLERAIKFLDENQDYSAYVHSMRFVSEDGKEIERRSLNWKRNVLYWSGDYLHISCFVFRRMSSNELLNRMCDDTGLEYVLATKGKWKSDSHIAFSYRQRNRSIMHKADSLELSLLELLLLQDILNYRKQNAPITWSTLARYYSPVRTVNNNRGSIIDVRYGKYIKAFSEQENNILKLITSGKFGLRIIYMKFWWLCFAVIRKIFKHTGHRLMHK